MFNLVKADLFKLLKDKPFKVILILLMLGIFIVMGVFILAMSFVDDTMPGMGDEVYFFQRSTIFQLFSLGILGLFVVLSTSMFTGKDFSQNTLRPKITSGNSRTKIFASLLIVNLIIGAVLFLITTIEGLLLALVFYGKIANFGAIIASIAMCIPVYISFICIATFISVSVKSQTLGILFNILIITVFVQILSLVLMFVQNIIPNNNIIELVFSIVPYTQVNYIVSGEFFNVITGVEGATLPAFFIAKAIISPLIVSALAFVGGLLIFKHADIK